jgi:ankyrin repeat protein
MKKSIVLFCALCFLSGVPVFAQEENEEPPVQYPPNAIINAAYRGDVEMLRILLRTEHDKDFRDPLGGTALHVAIFGSNLEVIRLLLDNGFDVNAKSRYNGYTPLHYCVWVNNSAAARILILYNADRNIRDNNGQTPQEKATREGKREMLLLFARS